MENQKVVSPLNITEELTLLIRGFFSTPVMSALSRLGIFEGMLSKSPFTPQDFPQVQNKFLLDHSFRYLSRLSLLQQVLEGWELTDLGKQIFQRSSSFYVPHSYHQYMDDFYGHLTGKNLRQPICDRPENILGSGRTHLRYFPFATSYLKRKTKFDVILDIGCGDGQFLDAVLKNIPVTTALGVDYSDVSVKTTRERLRKAYPSKEIEIVHCDAFDTEKWGKPLQALAGKRSVAISMWFLIHEISQNNSERILKFLSNVHSLFPEAPLVICEIVRHEDAVLAAHSKESIMPEYLFFHDISGQGVLSWKEYNEILQKSPYEIQLEKLFDEIPDIKGNPVPSSFVWCLSPKKSA